MAKTILPDATLPFAQTVRARGSFRHFLPTPLPVSAIQDVLAEAQLAPSNCNTQPWDIHVVSGAKLTELSVALHEVNDAGRLSPDFSWDESAFEGRLDERRKEHGKLYYESLGVARADKAGRREASNRNLSFYGAPHVALLFMPAIGDSVRVAGDLGMYGQTFLLALAARGLGGIPQTVLGLFANTIRETLGIPEDRKILFGISFGHPDETAPGNQTRVGRDPVSASVTFHA
jgi:nitroreductase